ncbi:MAG: MerR family transcriptional regulator [Verrucomicrobiota bacterium]|nr:MerR family transcriptional regulator [Verrucomicrobiota bacterium]
MKPVRTLTFVARQTGLTIHTIRIWEKRYGAVQPVRADNNRRLYTEEDVERLRLLREATLAGHAIGQIARASLPELERLVREAGVPLRDAHKDHAQKTGKTAEGLMQQAIGLVTTFDASGFTRLLEHAAVELGSPAVLQKFIAPLAERIGQLWRSAELTIAHEHFASHHITEFLATFARPFSPNSTAGHLVLATPSGQYHELGAIIVAAAARSHGWRTTYLGAALPVEEIVGAMRNLNADVIGLSLVFPPEDEQLRRDLRKLRGLLPKHIPLLIGGRSAEAYAPLLRELKAILVEKLEELYPVLDKLQRDARTAAKKRAN